ncbi:hypothetical protein [Clostridium saccharobutylicum]|uniref:Uncharacterized protein n=1 Tax=Clostridium saccharobutylicum DSM 13864 TaxID=1345695 RepID=U5N0E8_CLOSA|nr:hypothetical protein [Clostridium saccharobutylicum]AGX45376.1 hypothetical protein CLSA_c44390 [Clostridium saccharobutylicum DSM 13864]AQR92651.1 hypothetical protein CLOSC_44040 [Clostridium saccharobutylicum]AQS02553.1 hypothetical protein CSACC_44090 [Clostridium saccharobutylicum]AQS16536.1 hypothetical protein CLOSACC_44090 [Clostridium saccharobutylicum]MBA2906752.1 hypothetical protein [Clostridium saccharobutylicum]
MDREISNEVAKEKAAEKVIKEIDVLYSAIASQINSLKIKIAEAELKDKINYGDPVDVKKIVNESNEKIKKRRMKLKELQKYIDEIKSV